MQEFAKAVLADICHLSVEPTRLLFLEGNFPPAVSFFASQTVLTRVLFSFFLFLVENDLVDMISVIVVWFV